MDSSNANIYVADAAANQIDLFTLEPPSAPTVAGESVSEVSEGSATFQAEVNPRGAVTDIRFEYGPCASATACTSSGYEATSPGESVGSEFAVVTATPVNVQGLKPGTVYHFRLVAENEVSRREGKLVLSSEEVFTTRGTGEFGLPDGRVWELVSPADKEGALIERLGEQDGSTIQAAAGGSAITYGTLSPTESKPAGYDNSQQVLSTRGPGGWSSLDLGIPHITPVEVSFHGQEYRFFSEDLSRAVVQPFGAFTPCQNVEGAPQPCVSADASEQTAFLRTDYAGGGDTGEICTSSCYTPLVTGAPGYANVPEGTVFGDSCSADSPPLCGPKFDAATPDGSHILISSIAPMPLTEGGGAEYEWSAGKPPSEQLQPVAVLPASEGGGVVAGRVESLSDDGSYLFSYEGHLYVHDYAKNASFRLDVAQGVSEPPSGAAGFLYASSDGSTLLFSDSEQLTTAAGGGIYECRVVEVAGALTCGELDLTDLEATGLSAGSLLGGSRDASYLYFTAGGEIYVDHYNGHEWTTTKGLSGVASYESGGKTFYRMATSPNGEWMAFMSSEELTGYDNRDIVSGQPDVEVYEYNARTEKLVCASCNPTGARPHGIQYGGLEEGLPLAGGASVWPESTWLAANIPSGPSPQSQAESQGPWRYLLNDGRLFFNAIDALVPKDVSGQENVYEFESAGVGSCTSGASSGSVVFEASTGGCVALISSGESKEESAFYEASESGGDVFFLTRQKLTAQDQEGGMVLYDAHECTSESPCPPVIAEQPPACNTEASCKAAPSPQPEIFGPSGSATFSGAGNISPSPPVVVGKPKTAAELRAEKLAKALKQCGKDKKKSKRTKCDKSARKKYGASKAKKASNDRRAGR